jgi:hypothetical protein
MKSDALSAVIAGLDPAIHLSCDKKMDPRAKPAGDGRSRSSSPEHIEPWQDLSAKMGAQ